MDLQSLHPFSLLEKYTYDTNSQVFYFNPIRREAFIKKIVTFVILGSDPPPTFSGKCIEKPKPKKNKAFKLQY